MPAGCQKKIGKCLRNSAYTEVAYSVMISATMWKSSDSVSTRKRNVEKLYWYPEGGGSMTNSCPTFIIQYNCHMSTCSMVSTICSVLLRWVVKVNFTAHHKCHMLSAQSVFFFFFSLHKALPQLTDWLQTTWTHCCTVNKPCVQIAQLGVVLIKGHHHKHAVAHKRDCPGI